MPYARRRTKKDYRCDCRTSGMCLCTYSFIRGAFDALCGEDFKIGPNNLRSLLITLRKPEPGREERVILVNSKPLQSYLYQSNHPT